MRSAATLLRVRPPEPPTTRIAQQEADRGVTRDTGLIAGLVGIT